MSRKPIKPLTKDQAYDLIESLKKVFTWNEDAQHSELWFQIGMVVHEKAKEDK